MFDYKGSQSCSTDVVSSGVSTRTHADSTNVNNPGWRQDLANSNQCAGIFDKEIVFLSFTDLKVTSNSFVRFRSDNSNVEFK